MGEIREWVTLVLVVGGVFIAWRTYLASLRQQRLENSFKMLEMFERNLGPGDMQAWMDIFQGSYEGTGVKAQHFYWRDGEQWPYESLFSEGPPDNGAVSRICNQLELMFLEVNAKTVEMRVLYSHLGQLMRHVYGMIKDDPHGSFSYTCPNFLKSMKKEETFFVKWPSRTIIHCE